MIRILRLRCKVSMGGCRLSGFCVVGIMIMIMMMITMMVVMIASLWKTKAGFLVTPVFIFRVLE